MDIMRGYNHHHHHHSNPTLVKHKRKARSMHEADTNAWMAVSIHGGHCQLGIPREKAPGTSTDELFWTLWDALLCPLTRCHHGRIPYCARSRCSGQLWALEMISRANKSFPYNRKHDSRPVIGARHNTVSVEVRRLGFGVFFVWFWGVRVGGGGLIGVADSCFCRSV